MYATTEEKHVALPKLYGAPAYARPPKIVEETPRPLDPDELPLAVAQTDEERQLADLLEQARSSGMEPILAYATGTAAYRPPMPPESESAPSGEPPMLLGRPFRLRSLAERLLGTGR